MATHTTATQRPAEPFHQKARAGNVRATLGDNGAFSAPGAARGDKICPKTGRSSIGTANVRPRRTIFCTEIHMVVCASERARESRPRIDDYGLFLEASGAGARPPKANPAGQGGASHAPLEVRGAVARRGPLSLRVTPGRAPNLSLSGCACVRAWLRVRVRALEDLPRPRLWTIFIHRNAWWRC
jgi:hypothetical protein